MTYRPLYQSLILIVAGLFLTCKQPVDFLPSASQTGQNTLGCLIDGKPYVPAGISSLWGKTRPIVGGLTGNGPNSVVVEVYTFSKSNQSINLYLDDHLPGLHLLNTGNFKVGDVRGRKNYGQYISDRGYLLTSSRYTGWVNLSKVDTVSGIVSGTFEFTGADSTGATVSITNGRFDLNGRTQ